jgi:hypothetical protein
MKMRLIAHEGGLRTPAGKQATCSREFTRRVIKRNLTHNWYNDRLKNNLTNSLTFVDAMLSC